MDLHSGLPYWLIKNELYNYYNPLNKDLKVEVVVIGSGITGSLVAHELCEAGIACAVIDKRTIATGSSVASTSQLQYEIDIPLFELSKKLGKERAAAAYHDCLQSITDLEGVFRQIGKDPDFTRVPTYLLASNANGLKQLEKEFAIRKEVGLPVSFLTADQLDQKLGISALGALYNDTSAQLDCYKAATYLLQHHLKQSNFQLYSHTLITDYSQQKEGYVLETESGQRISCQHVVIAAGFEAGEFLPKKLMDLLSTYVVISQPVAEKFLWKERALIWETREPYLYMRTTKDNRIIVGGEDVNFENPEKRDDLLRAKSKILAQKFKKLFPDIPFVTDMHWCGTFSATEDGLPLIGNWPGKPRMHFALGYGGNGITFSMIAAQVIVNSILDRADPRKERYGFQRLKSS